MFYFLIFSTCVFVGAIIAQVLDTHYYAPRRLMKDLSPYTELVPDLEEKFKSVKSVIDVPPDDLAMYFHLQNLANQIPVNEGVLILNYLKTPEEFHAVEPDYRECTYNTCLKRKKQYREMVKLETIILKAHPELKGTIIPNWVEDAMVWIKEQQKTVTIGEVQEWNLARVRKVAALWGSSTVAGEKLSQLLSEWEYMTSFDEMPGLGYMGWDRRSDYHKTRYPSTIPILLVEAMLPREVPKELPTPTVQDIANYLGS